LQAWFDRADIVKEISRTQGNSHFSAVSWHCLLAGYGAFPPIAPNQPGTGDLHKEGRIEYFLNACASNFSSHEKCLNKYPEAGPAWWPIKKQETTHGEEND
jgi:hypothetical protein